MQYCEDRDNFRKNLIILQKMYNLTQKQMAQIMGCSLYCLRKAEQGIFVQTLYIDHIEKLCRHFQIHASALFAPPQIWCAPLLKKEERRLQG